jgi:hypothetical protein
LRGGGEGERGREGERERVREGEGGRDFVGKNMKLGRS